MQIENALKIATAKLPKISKSPRLDAEILLAHVLGKSREWLLAHSTDQISRTEITKFQRLVKARDTGKSVAALTHHKEFFRLDFYVNADVLIPRPETELLVETILKVKPTSLLEVGTGSGCIAIAVKKNLPSCRVFASDISAAALVVAKKNATQNRTTINFFKSDLLKNISKNFKMIAANLPYISTDSTTLEKSVQENEPVKALFGGADGLDLIRQLLTQIAARKSKPQNILLEIGVGQSKPLAVAVKKLWPKAQLTFEKDLAEIARVAQIALK